jgi:hypothetical protein
MAHLNNEKVSIWRGIIGRQQSSMVSAMRFCREESIPYWKFNYWKKQLAIIDGVANEVGSEEQQASFAEICLVQSNGGPGEKLTASPVAEVELPGGVTVRLYRQIDIQLISALIREVTSQ